MSILFAAMLLRLSAGSALAAEVEEPNLASKFEESIKPFLQAYCEDCHGNGVQEAKLSLSTYSSINDVARDARTWEIVLQRLEAGEMPPEEAERHPSPEQRAKVIEWIRALRKAEAQRHAGDPGLVPVRRLSNAEYNNTIRDLTGVDIQPTKEFPVDPANEAGFDNSGESLSMSPALLRKYLDAARHVTEFLVLKPDGFSFASHPVMTNTDRDKYCVNRIVDFYLRQPTDYADYFFAAWTFQRRTALGMPDAALTDVAEQERVSPKYLKTIWTTLAGDREEIGPIAHLQSMWRELPDSPDNAAAARTGCERMRDFVVQLRTKLEPEFDNLDVDGIHKGSQPFVLWKNRQYAAHRRTLDLTKLRELSETKEQGGLPADVVTIPEEDAERVRFEGAYARFCSIFPDAFYISERGRDYLGKPKDEQEKGRLLSAGFHSMMGYFRDDGPLYELILNEDQQRDLDRLWEELDFITSAPMRQYTGFVWFERTDSRFMRDPEFDFARAEDKDVTSAEKITRLSKVYLAKARANGGVGIPIQAIEDYFKNINDQIRWVEAARIAAEPSHLETLLDFAARAYRRPLSTAEKDDLLAFYRLLRTEELSHEDAIRDTVASILMSPKFCYRKDLIGSGEGVQPLSEYDLASRLSYFLWSSMPDKQLLERAAAGELHRPEVLLAEAKRMLQDDRVRGLATEFGGNWLDFRRFEEHNSVDRERFPSFTDELRQAMFEEPLRFIIDVVQNDRSVLNLLDGDYTFVNDVLAEHYGLPDLELTRGEWKRVEGIGQYARGGLLPMAVFLTKNAPGLRTSPVKRGYWVVRRLLGERIPPPPPNVPELPNDERSLGELTLAQTLARHRDNRSCAGCHNRFDSIGLTFENFGPIGERREVDLGGRPVETSVTFPDGSRGEGLAGLQRYIRAERQEDFLENLCRKLLSYGLGRTLQLSDDPLIEQMQVELQANDYRFGTLVEAIVTSPQFLNKRGGNQLAENGTQN